MSIKASGFEIFIKVNKNEEAALWKLNDFLVSNIYDRGVINFLTSYLFGFFLIIRAKHIIAFFLTFVDALFEIARSMIVSDKALTNKSGTIVAINDKAND
jgi:hypothetical protein